MGDALAIALLERKGFQEEDFAELHPGGELGRKLKRVEHLMHTGEAVPVVRPDDSMSRVIEEMSRKGFGMTSVVEDGRLTTWILSLSSARQLGLATTGHAVRGTSGPPSPATSNLYVEPGTCTPQELIADIKRGLYVTEMMGMGVNGITGDYSRGAAGFWIEDGQLTFPVSEVTIASNLKDMFRNLTPANDLVFRYGIDAPTLRIEGMTVAGS